MLQKQKQVKMAEIVFNNPEYLWLLLSIPLLIISHFFLLRHTRSKGMRFANFQTMKRIDGKDLMTKNYLVLGLRLSVLLCSILAISGSVYWYEGLSNTNDFIIAMDVSASMSTQDLEPTRLDSAKTIAKTFVDSLNTDSYIGIVTFSGVSFVELAPTKNKYLIKKALDEIEIQHAGGTDIPGAIITSTNLMLNSPKGKTIILITDGSSTVGRFLQDSIQESINYGKKFQVIIHTIGVGSDSNPIGYLPEYYNITGVYNEENLIKISNSTNGMYFQALNNEELITAYDKISQNANKAMLKVELSYGLMILAVLLLFIEWGAINTRFRKIP